MTDARRLLTTPLGVAGSGRVRYGAAMALFRDGALGEAALEAYRIASAHDGHDAGAPVGVPPLGGAGAVATLVDEIDLTLAGCTGDGPVEVRHLLGGRRPADPLPGLLHPVAARHLDTALAPLAACRPGLAAAIRAAASSLRWAAWAGDPPDAAFAVLAGRDGPMCTPGLLLGLWLIAPHSLCPDHRHAAPELCVPLTGPHDWHFRSGAPLVTKPAFAPVWIPAWRPHLVRAGPVPLIALRAWTRETSDPPQPVPATDRAAQPALRSGAATYGDFR